MGKERAEKLVRELREQLDEVAAIIGSGEESDDLIVRLNEAGQRLRRGDPAGPPAVVPSKRLAISAPGTWIGAIFGVAVGVLLTLLLLSTGGEPTSDSLPRLQAGDDLGAHLDAVLGAPPGRAASRAERIGTKVAGDSAQVASTDDTTAVDGSAEGERIAVAPPVAAPIAAPRSSRTVSRSRATAAQDVDDEGDDEEDDWEQYYEDEEEAPPETAEELRNRALFMLAERKALLALRELVRAQQLEPAHPDLYWGLGLANHLLARQSHAIAAFEKLISLAPNHKHAGKARTYLRRYSEEGMR